VSLHRNNPSSHSCHICHGQDVCLVKGFASLTQVTSDCRPWKKEGGLGICRSCGFVQKIADEAFLSDCEEIYKTYTVYYQADGQEQRVFEQSRGLSRTRSESILIQLMAKFVFPSEGTLLDFGCGNGNLLKSFSGLFPHWTLSGLEFNEKNRGAIEGIAHVNAFYSCGLMDVPGCFDMISMIHCLEHMVEPIQFLQQVREKLHPGGFVLIEMPDYNRNPFDLIIADHCTHFDVHSIQHLLEQCGFEPIIVSTDFVPKEITVLARENDKRGKTTLITAAKDSQRRLVEAIAWLKENVARATHIAAREALGVFGTSIAGTWLYNEIPEKVDFFVDEDPSRIGKRFMNRPVYHPGHLPDKGSVFIPLPYGIAREISKRLRSYGNRFIIPPPW
jgi:SAM-dependent methyltransferase